MEGRKGNHPFISFSAFSQTGMHLFNLKNVSLMPCFCLCSISSSGLTLAEHLLCVKGDGCEKRGRGGEEVKDSCLSLSLFPGSPKPGRSWFQARFNCEGSLQIKTRPNSTLLEDGNQLESSQLVSGRLPVGGVLAPVCNV